MLALYATLVIWLMWVGIAIAINMQAVTSHVVAGVFFSLSVIYACIVWIDYKIWVKSKYTDGDILVAGLLQAFICVISILSGLIVLLI